MGGADGRFHTTHWSLIEAIHSGSADPVAVLDFIAREYWKPVYCYLRRRGFDNEKAKDLTQGFFTEVVLGRGLVERADKHKGRFRNYLLTALTNYVRSVLRHDHAEVRTPPGGMVSLDDLAAAGIPEPDASLTPEAAFHHAWASAILGEVLRELEADCRGSKMAAHWEAFHARVLGPILGIAEKLPVSLLCEKLGVERPAQVSNMVVTVKRKFQKALRERLRPSVGRDADVDGEIKQLMQILS